MCMCCACIEDKACACDQPRKGIHLSRYMCRCKQIIEAHDPACRASLAASFSSTQAIDLITLRLYAFVLGLRGMPWVENGPKNLDSTQHSIEVSIYTIDQLKLSWDSIETDISHRSIYARKGRSSYICCMCACSHAGWLDGNIIHDTCEIRMLSADNLQPQTIPVPADLGWGSGTAPGTFCPEPHQRKDIPHRAG